MTLSARLFPSNSNKPPCTARKIEMIYFTKHARNKFEILKRHGVNISKEQVVEALENPDLIDRSRLPLLIVQTDLDQNHVLRVVYKQENNNIKVITFYPGRKN